MSATPWNSLEIVKLIISVLTPVAVLALGVFVARATARIEQAQWASQKVVEYRLKVFETVAPKLNKLLCFYTFVGRWKELTQSDVLILKRELDEAFYVNRALFSSALLNEYQSFTRTLFEMYAERGHDALIRAFVETRLGDRRLLTWWNPSCEGCFASENLPSLAEIATAYERLCDSLRVELYIPTAGSPAG